jgi:hypothetical protein
MTNTQGTGIRTEQHVVRPTKETKSSLKTTELYVFIVVSLAVLIAAAVVDNGDDGQGFGASSAWMYVTFLAVGYMISRGLAKAGSRSSDGSNDNR